jgi:hypothetical protein
MDLDIDCDSSVRSGSFTLSDSLSQTVSTALLQSESPDGNLSFHFSGLSFPDVYRTITERVLDHHFSILPFAGLLFSGDTEQMSETISFLTLADCLAFKSVSSNLTRQLTRFFLRLSSQSALLRHRLSLFSVAVVRPFIEFWAAGICATIATLFLSDCSSPEFFGHIERGVRELLIGFSPPGLDGFHAIVAQLVDHPDVPASVGEAAAPAAKPKAASETDVFAKTAETALASRAKMERRSCIPFPTRRGGAADDDGRQFSIAKALRIGQNVKDVVGAHAVETAEALGALRRTEKEFLNNARVPGVSPLGITFGTFNPSYGAEPAGRSPRRRRC